MAPPARSSFARRNLTWLVVVVGTGVSLLTWEYAARSHRERVRSGFLSRAQTQARVAVGKLHNYEEMVYGLRDNFLGQQEVTRLEFAQVAQAILQRHAGVQALQWVQIVPREKRVAVEAQATRELGRPYVIRRRQPDGAIGPAPDAPEYPVILYVEPLAGNEPVLGYDLSSAPTAPVLAEARASRTFRVSQVFRLVQSRPDQPEPGVVFVLPFARPGRPDAPIEGFLQGVFLVQTMLAQSHQLTTNDALETYYLDVTEPGVPTLLYANLAGVEPLRQAGTRLTIPPLDDPADLHETLGIGGRKWLMVIRQHAAWTERVSSRQPDLILLAGLTITALLALVTHSLLQRTTRIEEEVRLRTRELRASEARLQDIVDHSPALIFLKDLEGRYVLCNEPVARLCQRPRGEIIGRRDEDLFTPQEAAHFRTSDVQVITAGRPMIFEDHAGNAGDRRIYMVQKFPLLDEQGRAYALCGIATDITDRKTAEEQRLVLERQMLQGQKLESLGVLAGGVAHDFNNILTAILGNASLVALDLPPGHPARPQLEHIERAAQRAAELCAQMLAYAGRASFVTNPLNLAGLVRDTAALLEVSVGKRVQLDLLAEPGVPAVMGDATQLRQIVMNLVINAADAMGGRMDGAVAVHTFARELTAEFLHGAIRSPVLPSGRYVGLEVTDNGEGMGPEVLARIFDPFFTTKFAGRGLGLAAVLGIVQSHHGALFVESTPGQGTTFRLFLPTTTAQPADSVVAAPAAGPLRGTVLVVDDEQPVRQVAAHALTLLGVTVHLAGDGLAALEFLRGGGSVDLVLLDLTMPGLTGDETLRQLRELRPALRVVVMSGYSEGETMKRCASLGVSGYLPKPFDLSALTAKLQPYLR